MRENSFNESIILVSIIGFLVICSGAMNLRGKSIGEELVQVIELCRHGARTGIVEFPPPLTWKEGEGQLTGGGMREHYLIGKELYSDLVITNNFLSKHYNASEIYVHASDTNRTLMSAQSQAFGLYNSSNNLLNKKQLPHALPPLLLTLSLQEMHMFGDHPLPFNINQIPVHTKPKAQDPFNEDFCEYANALAKQNFNTSENVHKILGNYLHTLQELKQAFQISDELLSNPLFVYYLTDAILAANAEYLPLPLTNLTIQRSIHLHQKLFPYRFKGEIVYKLKATLIALEFINILERRIDEENNKGSSVPKLYIFSSHDDILSAFLQFISPSISLDIPFSSNFFIKLYRRGEGNYSVKVIYNGREVTSKVIGCIGLQECKIYDLVTALRNNMWKGDVLVDCAKSMSD